MSLIKECRGFNPKHGEDCWFAENATIVGDVQMGDQCSVWFNAVIRGDVNSIKLGNKVNIQDGAVLHEPSKKRKRLWEIMFRLDTMHSFMVAQLKTTFSLEWDRL